jgi:hypothetical protein
MVPEIQKWDLPGLELTASQLSKPLDYGSFYKFKLVKILLMKR